MPVTHVQIDIALDSAAEHDLTAIERINAAAPTEWVPGRKGDLAVELKRTVATTGLANTVEMRLANSEQEAAEEPSAILVP